MVLRNVREKGFLLLIEKANLYLLSNSYRDSVISLVSNPGEKSVPQHISMHEECFHPPKVNLDELDEVEKVRETCYINIDGTRQYTDNRFTPQLIEILFKFGTRTYAVKNNFRNSYIHYNKPVGFQTSVDSLLS